jgi:hypothetical protein
MADQFRELARFPVLEGKTWNDPVLVERRVSGAERRGDGRAPAVPAGMVKSRYRRCGFRFLVEPVAIHLAI